MIERVQLRYEELKGILDQALTRPLSEEEHWKLEAALQTLSGLTQKLEDKQTTIAQLQRMVFGAGTEKTSRVFPPEPEKSAPSDASDQPETGRPKPRRKGHGRKAAEDYRGAARVQIPHPSLQPGDPCPSCEQGKVYRREPLALVRLLLRADRCRSARIERASYGVAPRQQHLSAGAGDSPPVLRFRGSAA